MVEQAAPRRILRMPVAGFVAALVAAVLVLTGAAVWIWQATRPMPTFAAFGTLVIDHPAEWAADGAGCRGAGHLTALRVGITFPITGDNNRTVATGTIDTATVDPAGTCSLHWTATDIPVGATIYGFQAAGHRLSFIQSTFAYGMGLVVPIS